MADDLKHEESPTVQRLRWLREEFEPWLRRYFAAYPKRRSLLLGVSQYWSDEADDAVHQTMVVSNQLIPDWPGRDRDLEGDGEPGSDDDDQAISAWQLREEVGHLDWDDNSGAVRPFQSLCGEVGSQWMPPAEQDQPIVLAQRDGAGVTLTFIGEVLRPWLDLPQTPLAQWQRARTDEGDGPALAVPEHQRLSPAELKCLESIAANPLDDGPRRVWADACLERQDERAAMMTTREPPVDVLFDRGEYLLGELVSVVPLSTARFEYGSLAEAAATFDDATHALASSPWWLSVHTLRLSSSGPQPLTAQMRGVRHLRGLRSDALAQLEQWSATRQLRSLQVAIDDAAALKTLARLPLDSLESLTLVGFAEAKAFQPPPAWTTLERLTVLEPATSAFARNEDDPPPPIPTLRELAATTRFVSVGMCGDGLLAEGWRVEVDRQAPERARLHHERLGPSSTRQVRDALLEGLPSSVTTLELVPSRVWRAEPFEWKGRVVRRVPGG
jgi:hypothetical protein